MAVPSSLTDRVQPAAALYQGTTSKAAEKLGFVSGHDFSRAVKVNNIGL
jgi:hypothetical protein